MAYRKSKIIVIDYLFVLNQNSDLGQISQILNSKRNKTILILTTHKLYENELNYFDIFETFEFIFHTYAEFLDDTAMQSLDDKALEDVGRNLFNFQAYMNHSKRYKNIAIINEIKKRYKIDYVFTDDGLGIDHSVWVENYQAKLLVNRSPYTLFSNNILYKIYRKIFGIFQKNIEINQFEFNQQQYIFIGKISRLSLKNIKVSPKLINRVELMIFLARNKNNKICTTMHNYHKGLFKNLKKVYVFTDGFFPSNYPESYLNMFDANVVFVSDNFINQKWFTLFNKSTNSPFGFQKNSFLTKVDTKEIKNILLALNHAGDWSSLINRSDTDVLVEAFTKLAKKFPTMEFTIRTHLTMAHPSHEGPKSISRIVNFVNYLNLPNLKMSHDSLDKDLSNHDLLMSEYSNVLIQGFQLGKLGLIVNLTNRRNFMKDFSELGFLTVESMKALDGFMEEVIADINTKVGTQNTAIEKYNELQSVFLEGRV